MRCRTWPSWSLAGLLALNCGGSREPFVDKESTSTKDAGPHSSSDGGSLNGQGGEACSGLTITSPDWTTVDLNTFKSLRETGTAVGVAVSSRHLAESTYADIIGREFGSLTPENEMKWDTTEPAPGQFEFSAADRLVDFAIQRQMKVRGHTLVWHRQLPSWVTLLTGADNVRQAMKQHIEMVMAHFREQFPGQVVSWDVVNEALDSVNGIVSFSDSPFYRELGEGYIAEAFQFARAADPTAQLFYNDYGIEGMGPKSTATFELLKALVARGVPISGVGFQMHTQADDRSPTIADLTANLARYATIGLPVNISEMDVSVCNATGTLQERLDLQRLRYNAIAAACLRSGNCSSLTVWGLTDAYSWLIDEAPCTDATFVPQPLLFDDSFARKPAWLGLRDALLGCYYQ